MEEYREYEESAPDAADESGGTVDQYGLIAVRRPRRAADHVPVHFCRRPKAPDPEVGAVVASRPACSSAMPTADEAEAAPTAGAVR